MFLLPYTYNIMFLLVPLLLYASIVECFYCHIIPLNVSIVFFYSYMFLVLVQLWIHPITDLLDIADIGMVLGQHEEKFDAFEELYTSDGGVGQVIEHAHRH